MKYRFKDLIDIPSLQALTDELYLAASIPSAIVAMDGEILTGSGWQRVCTDFHRKHPPYEQQCIESDVRIRAGLNEGQPYVMYRCPRGLVDASSPVIIEGEHVASVFTGQLFLEAPDDATEAAFRLQARAARFDEDAYMAAFREIPVFSEDRFRAALSFLSRFAVVLAEMGLARMRELETSASLRATERRYRIVADNTYDWEFWQAPDGRFVYVSPSCERVSGHTAREFYEDPGLWTRIVHKDDAAMAAAHKHDSLVLHRAGSMVHRVVRPDGAVRWVEHFCQPILAEDGSYLGSRGSNRDITDRKLADERLQALLQEKNALLRELYHRTKNNMQVISSLLSLQAGYTQHADVAAVFREMDDRIRSMALVHQKLYQSQDLSTVDLADYVQELSTLLMRAYGIGSARVNVDLRACEVRVLLDAAVPCGLILNELITNAFKHAFPGDRRGSVTIEVRRDDAGEVTLRVADDGVGLPAGFDPRRDGRLGLQTVLAIGEQQLGGSVEFSSGAGVSCALRFRDTFYSARV
jgi:PAS domain S-box-containing protein